MNNNISTQPHILTLKDVTFEPDTGTIVNYYSRYTNIIIPEHFDGVAVTIQNPKTTVEYAAFAYEGCSEDEY